MKDRKNFKRIEEEPIVKPAIEESKKENSICRKGIVTNCTRTGLYEIAGDPNSVKSILSSGSIVKVFVNFLSDEYFSVEHRGIKGFVKKKYIDMKKE